MKGYIDEYGQPRVNLAVDELSIDAVIDTGFDGDLCLPIQTAIQLGLKLRDLIKIELADGSIKQELVFSGTAKFSNETKDIAILLTESEGALVGTNMFSKLKIDFIDKKVIIK